MPLVSVLTPSFNQGRFIRDCIASVLHQSYERVEHVISDGSSTDGTVDVLRAAPERVRWVSEPDGGQADALNRALSMARGEIIGWLNSDDAYYDRGAVEAAVRLFASRPEVDVVYGHAALVGADNELLHLLWSPRFSHALLRRANFVSQPTVFLRRSALGETLVDQSLDFALDRELWLRLAARGHRFARLDRIVAIDRHHAARKVYTIQDVGRRETEVLASAYGLSGGPTNRAFSKVFRVLARLVGIRLLRHASRPAAFDVRIAPYRTLLRRQLFTPRRWMSLLGTDPSP